MIGIKKLIFQIIKFGGVGVLCFIIDFAVLWCLTEFLKINVLISTAIAFTVSVVVNYVLSARFVFETDEDANGKKMFVLFVIFSVIGLVLTEIIMKIGVDLMSGDYRLVKIIATAIVMCYNFITRKLFMEKSDKKAS